MNSRPTYPAAMARLILALTSSLTLASCLTDSWSPPAPPCVGARCADAGGDGTDGVSADVQPDALACSPGHSDCDGVGANGCESPVGAACTAGLGACARPGVTACGNEGALDLRMGEQHTCAVTVEGGVRCWGLNRDGQLGDGTRNDQRTPVSVALPAGPLRAVAVACGRQHTCARMANGTVRCWGDNTRGQLGDGTTTASLLPVVVSGLTGVRQLELGYLYSCALLTNGAVSCWGENANAQVGDGTLTTAHTPRPVAVVRHAVYLATGNSHSCAVTFEGAVWCWGENSNGELGDGSSRNRVAPVKVIGIEAAVRVAAGVAHTCALLTDGTVRCWGGNNSGQLGNGSTTASLTPVRVAGVSGAVELVAGEAHTCARLSDGTVWCWGDNSAGQIGDGTTTSPRRTPLEVTDLGAVTQVFARRTSTCVRRADRSVQCWGSNGAGQLGDGTTVTRTSPWSVSNLTGGTTCNGAPATPGVETCNGVDDDCNGAVDDIPPASCLAGPCVAQAHRGCVGGGDTCVPDRPMPVGTDCGPPIGGRCDGLVCR